MKINTKLIKRLYNCVVRITSQKIKFNQNIRIFEDTPFMAKVFLCNPTYSFLNFIVYNSNRYSISTSKTFNKNFYLSIFSAIDELFTFFVSFICFIQGLG